MLTFFFFFLSYSRGFPKESPARNLPQEIYDKINDVHYPKLPKSQFDPS